MEVETSVNIEKDQQTSKILDLFNGAFIVMEFYELHNIHLFLHPCDSPVLNIVFLRHEQSRIHDFEPFSRNPSSDNAARHHVQYNIHRNELSFDTF